MVRSGRASTSPRIRIQAQYRCRSRTEPVALHRPALVSGDVVAGHEPASVRSTEAGCSRGDLGRRFRTDRRDLEIRASSYPERAPRNWRSEVTFCLRALTLTMPCARAPRRSAEPKTFPIGIVHSWSWAIGSSTRTALRSFDGVVSRRSARPFAPSAEWGLPENGRPSPRGTALWPGPGSRDGATTGSAASPRSQRWEERWRHAAPLGFPNPTPLGFAGASGGKRSHPFTDGEARREPLPPMGRVHLDLGCPPPPHGPTGALPVPTRQSKRVATLVAQRSRNSPWTVRSALCILLQESGETVMGRVAFIWDLEDDPEGIIGTSASKATA